MRLRVCRLLLLMMALLVPACAGARDEPALAVQDIRHHAMPRDGSRLPAPRGIAPGLPGERFVLDTSGRVLVFDDRGELLRQWRMPEVEAGRPEGVLLLEDGRIVVADTHYHRLVFFDRHGTLLSVQGEQGLGPGQFLYPVKLAQDDRQNLYVAEYGSNDRIQKFAPDGRCLLSIGEFGTGPGQFQRPSGVVWTAGKVYVTDAINNRIQVFSDEGAFEAILGDADGGPTLRFPYDLSLGPDGHLYTVEYGAGRVTALNTRGEVVGRFGASGKGTGQFLTPWALSVDERGHIWVADTGNRRMVELVP